MTEMDWLIDFIDNKLAERDFSFKRGIGVKEIFGNGKNQKSKNEYNLRLFKEFIKLYELKISGIFYSIYSKVSVGKI